MIPQAMAPSGCGLEVCLVLGLHWEIGNRQTIMHTHRWSQDHPAKGRAVPDES